MPDTPELQQEAFLEAGDEGRSRVRGAPLNGGSRKRKPLIILTIVIIIGAIIGLISWLMLRNYQSTDDAFIDGHVIDVSSRISAEVVRVYINDNQEVSEGKLLVELDPRDYQVALEKAQAQLLEAQAGVQQAQAQALQARAQLALDTAQFDIANINYTRDENLYQQDMRAVAKEDVDSTQATFDAAKATVEAGKATVQAAESQLGSARAAVNAAQAAVDDAALQLSYTRIVAAEPGRITRKTVEPGNYVTAGQTLFSIVQHDVWVTANFKETQLTRMKQGQPVSIRVDAFPNRDFKGHVDSFQLGTGSRFSVLPAENATGNYVKVVQRVPLKILFDEPEDALMDLAPGMSVEPKVNVGE
ncbi:MAG: HlyD family secretion protein [Chthoniobacteraceae bacterium]|jgi:membrane fusion protein (multidrug efflux system)